MKRTWFNLIKLNASDLHLCPQMTSVERVVEYTELESEAPWETQKRPPPGWPSKGLVTFDQVSFSYSADGPLVLQNLKAMFRPKEKVGHVYFPEQLVPAGLGPARADVLLCLRLVLWGERARGKARWSRLCSAWPSLGERSTWTAW